MGPFKRSSIARDDPEERMSALGAHISNRRSDRKRVRMRGRDSLVAAPKLTVIGRLRIRPLSISPRGPRVDVMRDPGSRAILAFRSCARL
jgi:hypothetical protein